MANLGGKASAGEEKEYVLFPNQIEEIRYVLSLVRSHLNQAIQDGEGMQHGEVHRTQTKVNKAMRLLNGEAE